MSEIKLGVDGFMQILSEALEEVPPLRDYDRCPKCGSIFIEWDPSRRRHCCLVRSCGWGEEKESLPLRSYLTGRDLNSQEILAMVLRYITRK